jgi:hypothetical protein
MRGQRLFQNWDGTSDMWTEAIPANLKPGNYLIQHEIIALYIANKPQFYPECAYLTVIGNGTESPRKEYLTRIPEMYTIDRRLFICFEGMTLIKF